ncbi:MAG: transglutaminase domain-containing protein [Spirochaetales bacterium]|nr:transglutaminase domain-containing protein [Spirochaetales bacterium]
MNYAKINRFTSLDTQAWISSQLQFDIDFIFEIVKSILIHPVDVKKYGIRYDRRKNALEHVLNNTVNKILSNHNLIPFLNQRKLPLLTKPEDRCILSCDHHALLFTSLMRNLSIPVRTRTGYAKYIVRDLLIPHWIVEVFDSNYHEWILYDPERCIKNVDRKDFLFANEAWIAKKNDPNMTFPSYSNSKDQQGIKYALISDINCIFKNELLGYEWRHNSFNKKKPLIVHNSYERLENEMKKGIDYAAESMYNPDKNISDIRAFYDKYIQEAVIGDE